MANLLAAKASSFSAKALTIRARPLISVTRVMVVRTFDQGEALEGAGCEFVSADHSKRYVDYGPLYVLPKKLPARFWVAALHSFYHTSKSSSMKSTVFVSSSKSLAAKHLLLNS